MFIVLSLPDFNTDSTAWFDSSDFLFALRLNTFSFLWRLLRYLYTVCHNSRLSFVSIGLIYLHFTLACRLRFYLFYKFLTIFVHTFDTVGGGAARRGAANTQRPVVAITVLAIACACSRCCCLCRWFHSARRAPSLSHSLSLVCYSRHSTTTTAQSETQTTTERTKSCDAAFESSLTPGATAVRRISSSSSRECACVLASARESICPNMLVSWTMSEPLIHVRVKRNQCSE